MILYHVFIEPKLSLPEQKSLGSGAKHTIREENE